jgi:hypothetical protein
MTRLADRLTGEELDRLLVERPAVVSVERAGRLFGMGRTAAYDAIREDRFPVPSVRTSGRRIVVPVAPLLRLLGHDLPANGVHDDEGRLS